MTKYKTKYKEIEVKLKAPVTPKMMKLLKRKLKAANWNLDLKRMFWAVSCILLSGSLRVHEILAREKTPSNNNILSTFLWRDLKLKTIKIEGKDVTVLHCVSSYKEIQSPLKENLVGMGTRQRG